MKIKSTSLGLIIFVLIFGGIFATSALNLWSTESSKIPIKFSDGDHTGEYNPEDIRGSYSFGDISSLFNIPIDDLKEAFMLPEGTDALAFQNKNLEAMYEQLKDNGKEIGNGSVKLFVALYKNLPIELDDDTYLPEPATQIIKDNNPLLTNEQFSFLDTHTISIDEINESLKGIEGTQSTEENESEEMKIKGKTTFKDTLDWGISKEIIEETIDGEMPNPVMTIRDYCTQNGLSFSTIKATLQEVLDNL